MIDHDLNPTQRAELTRLEVDWCNGYVGPTASGTALRAFPLAAADSCGAEPMLPTGRGIVESPVEPLRRAPAHVSEQISEAVCGELLERFDERDGWWLVRGEDGYVGWLRAWATRELADTELDAPSRRLGRYAHAAGSIVGPDDRAIAPVYLGTPLLLPSTDEMATGPGRVAVELPGGARGEVAEHEIETGGPRGSADELLGWALRLLGSAYRWGGRSGGGVDCSGLVQLAGVMAGFDLPRDAAQQALAGDAVREDEAAWKRGDLLFFNDPVDHVGIWAGDGRLLHARGRVIVAPKSRLGDLVRSLVAVRRPCAKDHITRESLWRILPSGSSS